MKIDTAHKCVSAHYINGVLFAICSCGKSTPKTGVDNTGAVNAFGAHLARAYREALLDPENVAAMVAEYYRLDNPPSPPKSLLVKDMTRALTAAVDHVFGATPESAPQSAKGTK